MSQMLMAKPLTPIQSRSSEPKAAMTSSLPSNACACEPSKQAPNVANFRIRTLAPTRITGTVEQIVGAGVLPRKEDRGWRTRDLRNEFLADSPLEVPRIADCDHKRIGSADHAVFIVRHEVAQWEGLDHVGRLATRN